MLLHRATLVVMATLFTAGMTSIASAGCCDWGTSAPVVYASPGCGGCGAPVTYAQPVAPAPITYEPIAPAPIMVGGGCGGCGASSAAVVFAQPVAPTPVVSRLGQWLRLRTVGRLCSTGGRSGAALRRQPGPGICRSRHHEPVPDLFAVRGLCAGQQLSLHSGIWLRPTLPPAPHLSPARCRLPRAPALLRPDAAHEAIRVSASPARRARLIKAG